MSEPVNWFTITELFKDDANCVKKGLNSCDSGRIDSITLSDDGVILGKVGVERPYVRWKAIKCNITVLLTTTIVAGYRTV